MAAATAMAVIAGSGALLSFVGQQQQAKAAKQAAKFNAREAELQAQQSYEQALQDEKAFRASFKRDQASNRVAIGASGIKLEGSPLEVLRDNAAQAEQDAKNILITGERQRDSFLRQARNYRRGGAAASQAAGIQGAATLLSGAVSTYDTYSRVKGD